MRTLPLALAALTLTTPAAAQDGSEGAASRTPAGAQRFLAAVAERGLVTVEMYRNNDWRISVSPAALIPDGDCSTSITGDWSFLDASVGSGKFSKPEDSEQAQQFLSRTGLPRPPIKLEWGRVGGVVRTAKLPWMGSADSARFVMFNDVAIWLPDAQTAERAEFAIKFLAEKCGIPADEGF